MDDLDSLSLEVAVSILRAETWRWAGSRFVGAKQ
jgi:hypothetical protein